MVIRYQTETECKCKCKCEFESEIESQTQIEMHIVFQGYSLLVQEEGCIEQLSRVVMTVYSASDSKLHMYEDAICYDDCCCYSCRW